MNSFEILGNGQSLDVAVASKLTTEFVATTFNEDSVFAGSYSYPITFPLTAKNIAFFEHSHHLENRGARKSREVVIVLFGIPWKNAVLDYRVTRQGYEGTLKVDNGAVAEWMRSVTLPKVFSSENSGKLTHRSIVLGNDDQEVEDHILNAIHLNSGYVWPTYLNSNAEGVLKSGDAALINDFDNMTALSDTKLYSPWFGHVWLLRKICAWMGYEAVGSYLEDQFFQSLLIYNNGLRTGVDWKAQKKINPAEHLPNITIAEYFKIIRNDHRVMIYFDSLTKMAHFELSQTLLHSESRLNLCDSIHYDSLIIGNVNSQSFKLITKIDEQDELYSNVSYEKSVMVGYDFTTWKELALGIGRLFMSSGITLKSIVGVILPAVQQLANIYSSSYNIPEYEGVYNGGNELSKNNFVVRMMSYKGLQAIGSSSSHKVPFCTGNDLGNGSVRYSNSLDHGGSTGLVNQYTLQYYRFFCSSEQVEVVVQLNILDFFQMHPLQKLYITDRNRVPVEALLDKVVFEPQNNQYIVGKVSCYPNYDMLGSAQGMRVYVGGAIIENTGGKIYAKLFARWGRRASIPGRPAENIAYNDITIEFYADPGAIIPYSVSNFPYKIVLKRYNIIWGIPRYYEYVENADIEVTGVANGTSHVHGEVIARYGWDYEYRPVLTSNGQDLTSLGSYEWYNGDWNVVDG